MFRIAIKLSYKDFRRVLDTLGQNQKISGARPVFDYLLAGGTGRSISTLVLFLWLSRQAILLFFVTRSNGA